MGGRPRHPARRDGRRGRRRAQPAADQGLGPRRPQRDRGGAQRWLRRREAAVERCASRPRCWASRPRPTCRRRSSPSPSTSRWCTRPRAPTSTRAAAARTRRLTRGEVAMTTAKAWRQKGTGRARVGALGVPHRYGGGAAFGPKPRHYTFKVNRKARRRALRAALTRPRRARHASPCSTAPASTSPSTKTGGRGAGEVGRRRARSWSCSAPRRTAAAKSFRNIPRVTVAQADRRRRRRRDRRRLAGGLRGRPLEGARGGGPG